MGGAFGHGAGPAPGFRKPARDVPTHMTHANTAGLHTPADMGLGGRIYRTRAAASMGVV
jgi:hypothetical protein